LRGFIDRLVGTHPRLVVGAWIALVAVAAPLAARQSSHLSSGGYSVPGSGSAVAEAVIKQHFREVSQTNLAVLFWPRSGASSHSVEMAISRVEAALAHTSGVSLPRQSREQARFAVGLGPVVMPLLVKVDEEGAQRAVEHLQAKLASTGTNTRVDVHLLGESALWAALDNTSKRQLAHAEAIGFPVLLIVLLVIFGSIVAAALPLILGATAVTITGAMIYLLSLQLPLSVFTTNTASMIGIGVAVDYSLIMLARIREEIHSGSDLDSARRTTLATAGRAIMFSGLTVIGALCGIFLVPIDALRSMALGAIIVVAVSVSATTVLLPAVVTILGARRVSRRWWTRRHKERPSLSRRWTNFVMHRPIVVLTASTCFLLVLCVPVLSLRTSTGALAQLGRNDPTRVGFSEAAQTVGAGMLGPIQVLASRTNTFPSDAFRRWAEETRQVIERLPGVHQVEAPEYSQDQRFALMFVVPNHDPESPQAKTLVKTLRKLAAPPGAAITVGGASATQLDEEHAVATSMWKVVVAVLGLAFLVLVLLLRSIVLPLKAVLTTLLSVGAAYGVLVAVFQWGWLHRVFNYAPLGHLETFTPPLILAIAFGLSTDYEVFLLRAPNKR
jgi:uncharacterized membrane protein YdfJ with MMPL/SSD domain